MEVANTDIVAAVAKTEGTRTLSARGVEEVVKIGSKRCARDACGALNDAVNITAEALDGTQHVGFRR